ncbi:sensor histidine kinase [Cellulomonas triticagri]|uniref:sensor histidine kinase n=1 Tax=Cellulomonas triticagri TaxID=2483352 RepID=UPI0013155190|nr:sensor histidine kinase [Cellulomonas triticagri]
MAEDRPAGSVARAWRRVSPFTVPRTAGDWASDGVVTGLLTLSWIASVIGDRPAQIPAWFWPVDVALGAVACLAPWWSRRYPVGVALLLVVPAATSLSGGIAGPVAVFRAAQLGRPRWALVAALLHVATGLPYHHVLPLPGMSWTVYAVVIPLLYALAVTLGLLSRSRRLVIAGLRESAARDRERYEERLAGTRREERERIAREMHDVLAHRISLLSVHAGALEFRTSPDAAPGTGPSTAEVRDAARVIRENAHLAVEDLRGLLGLLRADEDDLAGGRPQPRLTDIARLAAEAGAAGQQVDLALDVDGAGLRESTQRTVYRVVQESLTNARKHAPHAAVRVRVTGTAEGVRVAVDNAVPVGVTDADLPPGGSGLVGLAERVRLDGGTLRHGVEAGRFRVLADLPGGAR